MAKHLVLCAAGLLLACATYEQEPLEPSADVAGDGGASAGTVTTPRGGSPAAGTAGAATSGASLGGQPSVPTSGGGGSGGSGSGAGGSSGASGAGATGITQKWSFEQGAEGWAVRDQSPELSVALTPTPGAIRLVDVPFNAPKQFVDVAFSFPVDADLSGRSLSVVVQRVSGGFIGAQLYVYGGAWGSAGFESLSSGKAMKLTLSLSALASMGVTPSNVARVGIKLQTGGNAQNELGPTTIEITEATIE